MQIGLNDDYGDPDPEWLKIDWRPHLQDVELPGATVHYTEIGEGPPMVFVHGLSGCWQNWLENMPHFARQHRVIALDLPGFGDSPLPDWTIDMPRYGRMLHDFLDAIGVEDCGALIGHSMGGFIATEAEIQRPGRFAALVLVSAAGVSFAEIQAERTAIVGRVGQMAGPALARYSRLALLRPRIRRAAFQGIIHRADRIRPELLWEQVEPALRSPGFADALKTLVGYDDRHRLSEITTPILIVWGMKDRLVPVSAALSYHRRIAGSRLEIFERTGHVPMLERPARFNHVVARFLDEKKVPVQAGRA